MKTKRIHKDHLEPGMKMVPRYGYGAPATFIRHDPTPEEIRGDWKDLEGPSSLLPGRWFVGSVPGHEAKTWTFDWLAKDGMVTVVVEEDA